MASWEAGFADAQKALKEERFFDGVQHINACMEAFGKELDSENGGKIVQAPQDFLSDGILAKLTPEKKANLRKMFEVRGDIITGLGANKRAAVDYDCAEKLRADDAPEAKRAKTEAAKEQRKSDKVPVTVITGFLGSGKTTLLNRILHANHGKRIAIIENEFGEVGIDDQLLETSSMTVEEDIVEMNNGCICCTVRGDLIAGLKKFIANSQKSGKPLDGVMIETTGLADPAPVAQTFFADEFVQKKLALDGILTVVDAKHLIQHLDEEKPEGVENEAVEQLAFADRILLNKCDLVGEAELVEVERRIHMINESVPIRRCVNSEVDMSFLLGIEAFSIDKVLEMDNAFLDDKQDHMHDERVSSVGIRMKGEVDQRKLNDWIGTLLKEKGNDIFRTKGVLAVRGMEERFVFQAVHMAFKGAPQRPWEAGEERENRLTFIGKKLQREELEKDFAKCLV